jgi:hypothetical protein
MMLCPTMGQNQNCQDYRLKSLKPRAKTNSSFLSGSSKYFGHSNAKVTVTEVVGIRKKKTVEQTKPFKLGRNEKMPGMMKILTH